MVINELTSLMHLDYAAARAYEEVIKRMKQEDVINELAMFRNDHDRHVANLADLVRRHGGEPPGRLQDISGIVIEGFTAIKSDISPRAALEALYSNEKLTNKRYADAKREDWPPDVMDVINAGFNDEQRHIAYVESMLELAPLGQ